MLYRAMKRPSALRETSFQRVVASAWFGAIAAEFDRPHAREVGKDLCPETTAR